jgi:uncharacterized phage protein (TIGR02218 family)
MSYNSVEESLEGGLPIEMYEFVCSTGQTYRYTSYVASQTYLGNTYLPLSITRNELVMTSNDALDTMEIQLPYDCSYCKEQVIATAPARIVVNIYRKHLSDPEVITYFTGEVLSNALENNIGKVTVGSILGIAYNQEIPNFLFTTSCNHIFGGSNCAINMASYTVISDITFVQSTSITVSSTGGKPDGFFDNGVIWNTSNGEKRLILSQLSNNLILNAPLKGAFNGLSVTLTAGCDRSYTTCSARGNNLNFGGMPTLPTKNPAIGGIG